MPMIRILCSLIVCAAAAAPLPVRAGDAAPGQDYASVFVYNRVGDDLDPDTNVRVDQFQEHVQALSRQPYSVMPLPEIVARLKRDRPLPGGAVAITFDGGYRSVLDNAVPLLVKNGLPFTIFIAPAQVDRGMPGYLTWNDIRRLARTRLATFGLHSADYVRLADAPDAEILREINAAKARFREELRQEATLYAYPFGEYSLRYRKLVERSGFEAAFGQQSGVVWNRSDPYAMPRFSVTENYGDTDHFRMTADALPFPAYDVSPADPRLSAPSPSIGFTVDPSLSGRLSALSCFVSDQDAPDVQVIGDRRVEIRAKKPFTEARIRVNCTLPEAPRDGEDAPRWRWFGMLLTAPGNGNDAAQTPFLFSESMPAGG